MHNDKKDSGLLENRTSRIFLEFLKNEKILKRFLSRFVSFGVDVEDITQETISQAIQAEQNKDIKNPKAFLFGIAKIVVKSELSKKSKNILEFIEDAHSFDICSTDVNSEDYCDSKTKMKYFGKAVEALPQQCQKVFIMARVYGLSHREIANKLNISISTIEKHVAMGMQRCRLYMRKNFPGDTIDFDRLSDKQKP
jgi:RNA polymerase sigma factor (sigma-70 family)